MEKLTSLTVHETLDGLKNKSFSAVELTNEYLRAMEEKRAQGSEEITEDMITSKRRWLRPKRPIAAIGTEPPARWKAFRSASRTCFAPKACALRLVRTFWTVLFRRMSRR